MARSNNSANKKPPPRTHDRPWGDGSVKEVRPGVWRAWRARTAVAGSQAKHRPSRTFTGEQAAQRAAMWARGDVEPAVLLLGHWLDRWLSLRKPTIARNTYLIYRRDVDACGPLASRPLAALTVDDWQSLTNSLLERWGRYSVAVWRGNISTALRSAIPDHLDRNPMERVKLPKADQQPPKAWRQDEIDRLLAAAVGGLHETWLVFSLGTGVRLGEARALRWTDVDLAARTATIRQSADNQTGAIGPTKTRRVRVIDIPDEAIVYLSEHAKRQPPGEPFVFGHRGKPYDANAPRRWLRLQCKAAQVSRLPPHSLRHTYASLALDAGVPIQDIARQLGHTVTTMIRTYSHFIGAGQRRAANALGAALKHRFTGPKRLSAEI